MSELNQNNLINKLKDNWMILAILLVALLLRLFFFQVTLDAGQPSWWDAAEYLSIGLHYSDGTPYMVSPIRPPLFQYVIAGLIELGANEMLIILLLTLLPSVLLVYLIYLFVGEIINKRAGLIAAALTALSWNFIFWSNRAQPDFISLCVQVLAIYFFWKMMSVKEGELETDKALAKRLKGKYAMLAAGYAAFGFYFKISALLVPLCLAIFVLIKDRLSAFVKREYWIYLGVYLACFIPYCIWAYFTFGNIMPIAQPYSTNLITDIPFGWGVLGFFNVFGLTGMFWVFLIGMIAILRVLLYLDIMFKDKNHLPDYRILSLVFIIAILCFYIFYIRAVEDRWVFLLMPFMCLVCAAIIDKAYDWLDSRNLKWVAIVVVLLLVTGIGYEQVKYAGTIIEVKKTSYLDVKNAAIWLSQNTRSSDIIMSISYPQTVWYSGRHVETYSQMNVSEFEKYIEKNRPAFMTISIFEPHPSWVYSWVMNETKVTPVQVYYLDASKTQPSLVVYKLNYN